MPRYLAKPVEVEAFQIKGVGVLQRDGSRQILHEGGHALATVEMCARIVPTPGDYWVIQSDGYTYLNPRDVFERKYSRIEA